jgi:ribonuclease D
MATDIIADQNEFVELCEVIRGAGIVAFDTEFVSEFTYLPSLGLLQFATPDVAAAVDPLAVDDLTPWWEIMSDEDTTIVVHGGQAEIRFCLEAIDAKPRKLVDVQLAEGIRSRSYPLGYSNLVSRVMGQNIKSTQTRTDWLRRPLSPDQIKYALEDVNHVLPIWERQQKSLEKKDRLWWAESEFERIVDSIVAERDADPWARISGLHKLKPRQLAVAHEVAKWRDAEARKRNRQPRRILRDDLVIDVSRRRPKTKKELFATRDMNRPASKNSAEDILACVERAEAILDSDLPIALRSRSHDADPDQQVISKLLSLALSNRCAQMEVSQQLVANNADLQELVRLIMSQKDTSELPLMNGWRAVVCGDLLADVLNGNVAVRVAKQGERGPLVFEGPGA